MRRILLQNRLRFSIILLFFLGLLTLTFQNCQPPTSSLNSNYKMDVQFAPYIQNFLEVAESHSFKTSDIQLKVSFVDEIDFQNTAVGFCYKIPILNEWGEWVKTEPVIIIKKNYWTRLNSTQKKDLLFHELGHCLLNRSHVNTITNSQLSMLVHELQSQPAQQVADLKGLSIMNPYLLTSQLSANDYLKVATLLEDELFSVIENSNPSQTNEKLDLIPSKINHQENDIVYFQDEFGQCQQTLKTKQLPF